MLGGDHCTVLGMLTAGSTVVAVAQFFSIHRNTISALRARDKQIGTVGRTNFVLVNGNFTVAQ